ncbi:hypothetical protein ELH42_11880 [Rhizobium ruizarguesonis]|jgi:hypothetical protein|uniref:Uncharacterized protein n=1 Tax=Rhizobium ruizarguesonis TaxID=2081791 RepID=A0AB38HZD3_9HYPH|nr:hypothetical protein ELH85_14430 [Rhizobium ruizarguesonis]TCA30386.1 hypothetical protein E0H70_15035 [Rhizobium leguminosarum bv. viciae]TAZ78676.1 hypothetical protein ELH68_13290 [Rhizobium ruizarguesonis]TBA05058.1 hypothetical protein ELH64_11835 [Rhizobium ruizarguesonis]TBA26492.1 hypothetical protein ELH61_12155 [Rhizobium ruizarguesonis]
MEAFLTRRFARLGAGRRQGEMTRVYSSTPFYFMIYSHIKYTLRLRVLGCYQDMGMRARDVTVGVDARIDTPVGNMSD